jgi:hypothetical protein
VSRREEHLRSYAAQIEDGFFAELLVRRGQLRAMEEGMGFLALAAQAVESGIVEHGNLGRKLLGCSLILGVSVDVDSEVAKEAIAADMIEVFLGVHSQDSTCRDEPRKRSHESSAPPSSLCRCRR